MCSYSETSMHFSKMWTFRLLTISCSILQRGLFVCKVGLVSAMEGGFCLGQNLHGVCLPNMDGDTPSSYGFCMWAVTRLHSRGIRPAHLFSVLTPPIYADSSSQMQTSLDADPLMQNPLPLKGTPQSQLGYSHNSVCWRQ